MHLVAYAQSHRVKTVTDWDQIPTEIIQRIQAGTQSTVDLANRLENLGWELRFIVPIAGQRTFDQEFWFHRS